MQSEGMVTARMTEEKKRRGARVLAREGLNASQAINHLHNRIIEENDARFLGEDADAVVRDVSAWKRAARFVDSLSEHRESQFDTMIKAEIRTERLRARGLM